MMGWKIKLKNALEWDMVSRWRKQGILVFKPGTTRWAKRGMRRRARREAKKDLKGKY